MGPLLLKGWREAPALGIALIVGLVAGGAGGGFFTTRPQFCCRRTPRWRRTTAVYDPGPNTTRSLPPCPDANVTSRTLDTHVSRVRNKLGLTPEERADLVEFMKAFELRNR